MTNRGRSLLFAGAAGALNSLCWLPLGFAPALPLAALIALRGLRKVERTKDAVLFGLVFGAVRVAVGGHYILSLLTYSSLAPVLLGMDILYYLPFDIALATGALWFERRARVPRAIGFALLYVALEWARALGDLSNCSDTLAHAFGTQPGWLAWSAWTGPYFIALLSLGTAVLLDAAFELRGTRVPALLLTGAAVLAWFAPPLTTPAGRDTATATGTDTLRVGIVQPSIDVAEKLDRTRWPATWTLLEKLTADAAKDADLVVWPETARPGAVLWRDGEPFADPEMEALARKVGVPILYGCEIARIAGGRVLNLYNAAALAHPDGTPGEWYAKQQLLPFVEGVPFASWFRRAAAPGQERGGKPSYLTLFGHFSAGTTPTLFHVKNAKIGVLICYEGFYPQLVRRYRMAGANALCVMTNDAWWGQSFFARWHARMVASRATEADVPVVRAANSGVSSITDRRGQLGAHTGIFETTTLHVALHPSTSAPTFYARTGDLLVWVDLAALALLAGLGLSRRGPRAVVSPGSRVRRAAPAA